MCWGDAIDSFLGISFQQIIIHQCCTFQPQRFQNIFWTKEGTVRASRDHIIPHRKGGTFEALYSNILATLRSQELCRQGAEIAISLTHYAQWRGKKEIEHDLPGGHGEDTNSTAFSPFVFTPLFHFRSPTYMYLCFFPHWLYDPKTMPQTGTQFPFCNLAFFLHTSTLSPATPSPW